MTIKEIYCDNCGTKYYICNKDKNKEEFCHRVCDTCYMPIKIKNPYYNGETDEEDTNNH